MNRLSRAWTGLLLLALVACRPDTPPPGMTQAQLDAIADTLVVRIAVTENRVEGDCGPGNGDPPCFFSTITLRSPGPIGAAPFEIYYSQVHPLVSAHSHEFGVANVNGDLHRISTTPDFHGFAAGEEKRIDLVGIGAVLTEAKLMPNYYVAAPGLVPRVIASTRLQTDPDSGLEVRPYALPIGTASSVFRGAKDDATEPATAAWLYRRYGDVAAAARDDDSAIIPTPRKTTRASNGARLDLSRGIAVSSGALPRAAIAVALARLAALGIAESPRGVPLVLTIDAALPAGAEGYRLNVGADRIDVVARDAAGAFYALESIAALVTPGRTDIAQVAIEDAPRYAFRGMHVDVGRNFHSKRTILALLDQMAAYKLNRLHFHLADDEGWRVQIAGLPELTDVASRRCHDLAEDHCLLPQLGSGPDAGSAVDGYYTADDYIEIVRAAAARHIDVIPSFDMPGHSRALVKAMEARHRRLVARGERAEAERYLASDLADRSVYRSVQHYRDNTVDVCRESTYAVIGKVVDELAALHAKAGQPLKVYHIGADETAGAWTASPSCNAFLASNDRGVTRVDQLGGYFIARVAALLDARGIGVAAWSDGLSHVDPARLPGVVQSNAWGTLAGGGVATAHAHANRGWRVVLSLPDVTYFDFPYAADPVEHGYHWAARHVDERKVFELMPDNLPAHAAIWGDALDRPLTIDDTLVRDASGAVVHAPLRDGVRLAGIQGHAWSETLRSDALLEHMVFPRLLALAERAWHHAAWEPPYRSDGAVYSRNTLVFPTEQNAAREADWARFATVVGMRELPKLVAAGVQFRVPPPGAVIVDGTVRANAAYPGLGIDIRIDAGEWTPYRGPVAVQYGTTIELRGTIGTRRSRVMRLTNWPCRDARDRAASTGGGECVR